MPDLKARVALTRKLARGLQEFLSGLSPEDLSRPSACAEWEIQDVVSHLAGGAERQIDSINR